MPKKIATENINAKLGIVMRSGKALLGLTQTLKAIRKGMVKMVIVSSNCPNLRKSMLEYYCMLSKTQIYHYTGTNIDLGAACGRYHRVSCVSIIEAGDSDILTAVSS
eukprot:TRINITY_DN282_c0_g1_i1.p2 TRINITY_DN282_c0_g1~~TRINITY_DN282_c0_g1_i1.p2  ORF type:complete len:107 (+),score=24.32 TRINITY_DN282_c0_g1_i1:108-428(+)